MKLRILGRIFLSCIFILMIFAMSSCDETYTPRPKGYFRIGLPEKKYVTYNPESCPYQFDIPAYAEVKNYHDSLAQPCWKYIQFPQFNGEIFLSYRKLNNDFSASMEEARTLAYKHTVRASGIDETVIQTHHNVYAIVYDIGGNAASSIQFFATDSTKNFLRGALYFNMPPQPDSLAPVIAYLRTDVFRMIESIRWKK